MHTHTYIQPCSHHIELMSHLQLCCTLYFTTRSQNATVHVAHCNFVLLTEMLLWNKCSKKTEGQLLANQDSVS